MTSNVENINIGVEFPDEKEKAMTIFYVLSSIPPTVKIVFLVYVEISYFK